MKKAKFVPTVIFACKICSYVFEEDGDKNLCGYCGKEITIIDKFYCDRLRGNHKCLGCKKQYENAKKQHKEQEPQQ